MSVTPSELKAQQWAECLKRFRESGQSVANYCKTEGISQPSLYYWKKRLDTGIQASQRGSRPESAFRPVQLSPATNVRQNTKIRLAGAVEIELGNDLQVVDVVVQRIVKETLQSRFGQEDGASC